MRRSLGNEHRRRVLFLSAVNQLVEALPAAHRGREALGIDVLIAAREARDWNPAQRAVAQAVAGALLLADAERQISEIGLPPGDTGR